MVGSGSSACAFTPNLPSNHPRHVARRTDLISKVIEKRSGTEEANDVESMGLAQIDKNREYLVYPHAKGDFADFDDANENNFATCEAVELAPGSKQQQLDALNKQYVNLIQDNGGRSLKLFTDKLDSFNLKSYKHLLKQFVGVLKAALLLNVNGICHRDIKMLNITVDPRMRLIDFGLSTKERLLSTFTHASFANTDYEYWPVDYKLAVCFANDAFHSGSSSSTDDGVIEWYETELSGSSNLLARELMLFLRKQGLGSDEIRFILESCHKQGRWPNRKRSASQRKYLHALRLKFKVGNMPRHADLLRAKGVETYDLHKLLDVHVKHAAHYFDTSLWIAADKSSPSLYQERAADQLADFVLTCQSKLSPAVSAKERAAFLKKLEADSFLKLDVFSAGVVMLELASKWQEKNEASLSSSSSSSSSRNTNTGLLKLLKTISRLASQMIHANPFKRLAMKTAVDKYLDALLELRVVTKAEWQAHKAEVACVCKTKRPANTQCKSLARPSSSQSPRLPSSARPAK